MIASMSKYSFLIHHEEYLDFLQQLRQAGVVHIKDRAEGIPDDDEIVQKMKLQQEIKETTRYLTSRKIAPLKAPSALHANELIEKVKHLRLQLEVKKTELQAVVKELGQLEPWGEFSWPIIDSLKKAGHELHFYSCNKSKFDLNWIDEFNLFEISRTGSTIYFVIMSPSISIPDLKAEPVKLPHVSIEDLLRAKANAEMEMVEYNSEIDHLAAYAVGLLNDFNEKNKAEIDFRNVVLQADDHAGQKLKLLEGWVPTDNENQLAAELDQSGAYYMKRKPGVDDSVPVLLKNNAFTKLFEIVGSLYSLPSYREIDLTPFFAPFFMLFFGFCLGDSGYGLLMMIATLILRAKAKPNMKPIWTLGFFFGVSTVIMGLIGGTVFGIMLIDVKFSWLATFQKIILNQNQLMYFSIALGLVQIVFGMCLKAARAIKIDGFKYALSTIGWVIIIIGVGSAFGLSKYEIISTERARLLMIVFGTIGGILALFFNSPGKNIFLNFGLGLWDTYGTVTGLLGDVLSYIRLFALGLSSAVLGSVFNKLAFELTGNIPVLSVLFTLMILLLGHTINFFMAALGAFVHPLRLTFVEFYKNTGFEGGGKKYTPFRAAKN